MDQSNHSFFNLLDAIAMPTIVFTKERKSCFINQKAYEVMKISLVSVTADSLNALLNGLDLNDLTVPLVAQRSISGENENAIDIELNLTKFSDDELYYICSFTVNSSKQPLNLLEKKMGLIQKNLAFLMCLSIALKKVFLFLILTENWFIPTKQPTKQSKLKTMSWNRFIFGKFSGTSKTS